MIRGLARRPSPSVQQSSSAQPQHGHYEIDVETVDPDGVSRALFLRSETAPSKSAADCKEDWMRALNCAYETCLQKREAGVTARPALKSVSGASASSSWLEQEIAATRDNGADQSIAECADSGMARGSATGRFIGSEQAAKRNHSQDILESHRRLPRPPTGSNRVSSRSRLQRWRATCQRTWQTRQRITQSPRKSERAIVNNATYGSTIHSPFGVHPNLNLAAAALLRISRLVAHAKV